VCWRWCATYASCSSRPEVLGLATRVSCASSWGGSADGLSPCAMCLVPRLIIRRGVSITSCPGLADAGLPGLLAVLGINKGHRQHCGMKHWIHCPTGLSRGSTYPEQRFEPCCLTSWKSSSRCVMPVAQGAARFDIEMWGARLCSRGTKKTEMMQSASSPAAMHSPRSSLVRRLLRALASLA
jgi:hypothetical protein